MLSLRTFPFLFAVPFCAVSTTLAQNVAILDQAPNQSNITFSDASCDACGLPPLGTGQQSVAENFVVSVSPSSSHFSLNEVVVWGGHYGATGPQPADFFTIKIHSSWNSLPTSVLYTESGVAHTAVPTGNVIFATDEIKYTFALANPPQLASGTYWLEIFNDTAGYASVWGIETGTLDAVGGLDGFAFSIYAPGSSPWSEDLFSSGSSSKNFAMQIMGTGAQGTGPIQPYCSGVGCPCGNEDATAGCSNSSGAGGLLDYAGTASVAADDLVLTGANLLPGNPAMLFVGNASVNGGSGSLFGDGLRCAGGGATRLGVQIPDANGAASWGSGLASAHGWSAGDTGHFQIWYRDSQNSPCSTDFNLSNGLEVVWQL